MLTHLLMCDHKSAYASEEDARANTVGSGEDLPAVTLGKPAEETPAPAVEPVSGRYK